MGQINEAIVAYNSALARNAATPRRCAASRRPICMTGKPQLAGEPLSVAYQDTPDDPKLLQLIGVADDYPASTTRRRRDTGAASNSAGRPGD